MCVCKETVVCEGCLKEHLASHASKRTRIVAMQHPVLSVLYEGAHNVSDADERYYNCRYEEKRSEAYQEDIFIQLRNEMLHFVDDRIHQLKLMHQSSQSETALDISAAKNALKLDIQHELKSKLSKFHIDFSEEKDKSSSLNMQNVTLGKHSPKSPYFRDDTQLTFEESLPRRESPGFYSSRTLYKEPLKKYRDIEHIQDIIPRNDTSITDSSYFPDGETLRLETPEGCKKDYEISEAKKPITLRDLLYSTGELKPPIPTKDTPRELLASYASYTTKASDFLSSQLASTSERNFYKANLSIPSVPSSSGPSYKIVLLGDQKSGKSQFISTYIKDSHKYRPKLGLNFTTINIQLNSITVNLEIWDVKANTRLKHLSKSCYFGAKGAIILFDMTEELSYYSVVGYMKDVFEESSPGCQIFIVGNKLDKLMKMQPTSLVAQISTLAINEGAHYDEISSLNYQHVESLMKRIAEEVYKSNIRL
jgi:Ras-related protein Rab-11A